MLIFRVGNLKIKIPATVTNCDKLNKSCAHCVKSF